MSTLDAAKQAGRCSLCPPVLRNGHPAWYPPANDGDTTGLCVQNSLTNSKESFVAAEGRKVRWYTCGPTVYDVAHMGHARAYLTFDILRRIMEDHLGYEVIYQINITDIDDKIILRARRNKLLADYRAAGHSLSEVKSFVDKCVAEHDAMMNAKLARLSTPLPAGTPSLQVEEHKDLLDVHQLKMEQWAETKEKVAAARASEDVSALIDAAVEPLAERLDADLGSTVSDQSVFEAHARLYEAEFLEDMSALGVRPPTIMTRVTEYVPEIVAFVLSLVEQGLAYESNGSVYMDLDALKAAGHDYRKLVPTSEDTTESQMSEGEGALACGGEKRGKNDFALWKASKPGEPSWDSPWGGGRPGWHIECSVMGSSTFGPNMDIHAGGSDLKFPHHDNELAQSEAFHGCCQWVNYFLHAGHLNIKGKKMSKSLKNFVTIREALNELGHSARQIRLMFLSQPWDKSMQYSDQTIAEAKNTERKLKDFFGAVKAARREPWLARRTAHGAAEEALSQRVLAFQARVHDHLLDNFNTPAVMADMLGLAGEVLEYMRDAAASEPPRPPAVLLVSQAAMVVTRVLRTFGVAEQDDIGLPIGDGAEGGGSKEAVVEPYVDALVKFRDTVRAHAKGSKDSELLALCDQLRDATLAHLGVRVEDPTGGAPDSLWKLDDPQTLLREIADKAERAREKEEAKMRNKLLEKTKELAKARAAEVPSDQLFRQGRFAGKYSGFDDRGVPTTDGDGNPLPKSALKAVEKELAQHGKAQEALRQKQATNPAYLDDLHAEVLKLVAAVGGSAEDMPAAIN